MDLSLTQGLTFQTILVKELCKADGQVGILHRRLPLALDGGGERGARQDGVHLEVEVPGKDDEEGDDEGGQHEPGEVVGPEVVPLGAVDARRVREEAQAVVGQEIEALRG